MKKVEVLPKFAVANVAVEVSLVPVLVLNPDMSGQVDHRLQTNRADLLDSLVDRLNVRLQSLIGGELGSALAAFVTNWLLVIGLPVPLMVLFGVKIFFASLALKP